MTHQFLFSPGMWLGEGTIQFTSSPESIRYYTRWTVGPMQNDLVVASQIVEIQGVQENITNKFTYSTITENRFNILLENELVNQIKGSGVYDIKSIAWEFRGHPTFEGFEILRLQDNGEYRVHAEYVSIDSHRTSIQGRIWKKET